jgi:3-deoxy-D-manno-oct-2-ulosonic acid (Kdo) hydroxylase
MTNPGSEVESDAHRLERGEVVVFPQAPFPLPELDDRAFLLEQQLGPLVHKNISYDPATCRLGGHVRRGREQEERLRSILLNFSQSVTTWLPTVLPGYVGGIDVDRVSFRPLEEATRRLRATARNDLLHVDAFPNRPSQGRRLLRLFVNLNPTEPRVWATSEPFTRLLERFRAELDRLQPSRAGWLLDLGTTMFEILRTRESRQSEFDRFMLRLHDFLKTNEEFQERARKKILTFPPGSAWLAMTDGFSYGELRGQFALEHSFFIRNEVLGLPECAPMTQLARARGDTAPRAA